MTAVCDLWKVNRERAVSANKTYYGTPPRAFQYLEELLLLKDVDVVLISTPEHSHSPILKLAAEAGKDAYVEKPMGNVLEEVKAARDAVLKEGRIVQVGTQHRSEPYPQAAYELIQTGALGEVSKVEIVWNFHGPRWRGRREVKQLRPEDTDWSKWLMTKPDRPFDPQLYFEFRLYKEFSSGIADQWMSHAIDLVHWFMGDPYLRSVVAHGGIFAWPDGRQNPDTFQALLEYPKGFLVSYSTSFGNDAPSFARYMGKKATLMNIGGEGSPRYNWWKRKATTKITPMSTSCGLKKTSCFLETRGFRPQEWATSTCITWKTGSNACAAASSRTLPCVMATRTRWRALWQQSPSGGAKSSITIRRRKLYWIMRRRHKTSAQCGAERRSALRCWLRECHATHRRQ